MKKRVKFTFPEGLITEPLIYNLGQRFKVITDIRRADIRDDMGWVVLEIQGVENEVTSSIDWAIEKGVRIDSVGGDVIEG